MSNGDFFFFKVLVHLLSMSLVMYTLLGAFCSCVKNTFPHFSCTLTIAETFGKLFYPFQVAAFIAEVIYVGLVVDALSSVGNWKF